MSEPKTTISEIYISLGSNMGQRFENLQEACNLIVDEIGEIRMHSKIYETPAWGFVSSPFLNACICVKSLLTTKEILLRLQQIEKKIGRKKKQDENYEARPIDLDIIYSSEGIFKLPHLTVPHPLLQDRKFVLMPLLDIATDLKHPLLHKTTQELFQECNDSSEVIESKYSF